MDNGKYNHYQYCEAIARKLKPIQHSEDKKQFFEATEQDELETLEARLSDTSGILFIAIDGSESAFGWKNSDSLMEQPTYKFAIVEKTLSDDSSTIFKAQQHCKAIAMQVIAQMMQDAQDYKAGMELLDPGSFQLKGFGPIGNNYYGILVGFSFDQGINYNINPELWV
ncbi:hypothetical protein JGH11_04585 [Dysgonomonas sp. Marseille-P4677]|uniref:hypothetical protein n=1 Tax=Dysgonomonas sp. Marseille-P4677 TaxID=2364790 RepID=UPI001913C6C3|nr:hypothetical protein [Dysgonomonas sp. Marseille-P4677]MBK5720144.1 hypothetical protein [Dysgonomonas sp. Marseille-P4677]